MLPPSFTVILSSEIIFSVCVHWINFQHKLILRKELLLINDYWWDLLISLSLSLPCSVVYFSIRIFLLRIMLNDIYHVCAYCLAMSDTFVCVSVSVSLSLSLSISIFSLSFLVCLIWHYQQESLHINLSLTINSTQYRFIQQIFPNTTIPNSPTPSLQSTFNDNQIPFLSKPQSH